MEPRISTLGQDKYRDACANPQSCENESIQYNLHKLGINNGNWSRYCKGEGNRISEIYAHFLNTRLNFPALAVVSQNSRTE